MSPRSALDLAIDVPSNKSFACSGLKEASVLSAQYSGKISADVYGLVYEKARYVFAPVQDAKNFFQ